MPAKKTSTAQNKSSHKQVMDVHRPGKVAPSASSKPVIVGHKPTVQDPMVNEEKSMPEDDSKEHKIEVKRTAPKVIAPLSTSEEVASEAEAETDALPGVEQVAEKDSADTTEPTDVESESEELSTATDSKSDSRSEPRKHESKKPSKSNESSVVDAVASKAAKNKDKKADQQTEEIKKRLSEVEKLVEEKKYFVHTSQTTKKQRRNGLLALLIILLLLVGSYLALDAQLIKNDIELPYEFFEETTQPEPTTSSQAASPSPTAAEEAQEETKQYVDTAGYFSLRYPTDWSVKPQIWNAGSDGQAKPEPDWTKVSRGLSIDPKAGAAGNNVTVTTDCMTVDSEGKEISVLQSIKDSDDKFHTQRAVQINGYDGFYDKLVFVGENETYTRHTYFVTDDKACVTLVFTENHRHPMSGTNFDDKNNMPSFEAVVQSVTFLK